MRQRTQVVEHDLVAQLDAAQVQHGVLHGLVHVAALAGALALQQRRQHADGQVHAGVGVAQGSGGLSGHVEGALVPAGRGGGTAGRLGHGLEGLHMRETALLAEALQRRHDAARVDGVHLFPTEAQLLHITRADVLDEQVGLLQQLRKHFLALGRLHVQRERLLAGVQLQVVHAPGIGDVQQLGTGRVAARTLDLDDFGAHPGK